jgi:hypothetical protein
MAPGTLNTNVQAPSSDLSVFMTAGFLPLERALHIFH